jgi:hypothetical protein
MSSTRVFLSLGIAVLFGFAAEQASAQAYLNRVQPPKVKNNISAPRARGPATFKRQPISKPFKHIQQRPTVSPYLNLVRDDSGAAANYQTLVRPQMEQIDYNRQQENRLDHLNRQFQNFRSESAYPLQGSQDIRETGHITQFMNLSHYYPQ